MTIGFNADISEIPEEINTIEELQTFLSMEARQFSEFESELILELKEVKHMESNLRQLEIQMKTLEILMKQYNENNRRLYFELHKRESINLEKCHGYITLLEKIRSELFPLNKKMIDECERLFLRETHQIYSESEDSKKRMKIIDDKARVIVSKINLIDKQAKGVEEEYAKLVQYLKQLQEINKQKASTEMHIEGFHK